MELKFCPTTIFRETPKVTFFDASFKKSNGCNVVIHSEEAISPHDDFKDEQYNIHNHQIDRNLVITWERTFVLINPSWDEPHHVIYLNKSMGAIEIPIWTHHRSISGKEGSIVVNQPKIIYIKNALKTIFFWNISVNKIIVGICHVIGNSK